VGQRLARLEPASHRRPRAERQDLTSAEIEHELDQACDEFGERLETMVRFRALQILHLGENQGITELQSVESALYLTAVKLRGLANLLEERAGNLHKHHRPAACRRPARLWMEKTPYGPTT
jgi:hypothetical protein